MTMGKFRGCRPNVSEEGLGLNERHQCLADSTTRASAQDKSQYKQREVTPEGAELVGWGGILRRQEGQVLGVASS